MYRTKPLRMKPAHRALAVLGAAALGAAAAGAPARGAEPAGYGYGPGYGGPAALPGVPQGPDGTNSRRLDLSIGRSVIIDLPRDAKEVFVANPAVANAVVRSARRLFLIGVANGGTSVFAMDGEGRQIATFEVSVGRDLNVLRQALRTAIPSGRIEIRPAGDSILLTGTVASPGEAQQALDIAKAFVGQSNGGTPVATGAGGAAAGGAGGGGGGGAALAISGTVINALTIAGRDQVMLKVTVVEIARSVIKQLGINVGGNWNIVDLAADKALPLANPASNLVGFATGAIGSLNGANGTSISGQFGSGNANVGGTLSALERLGLSRTLAEPTLVAISGESAVFLAGGEVPYPVNSCTASGGGSSVCTPSIQFKNVGVQLGFTPVVLAQGRISLHVTTEVNELDRDNSITLFGTSVPGFRTRKTATTVELPSGASMVTAGLISSQGSNTISGVPGLINLPVLGALFRSRDFQRRDSELMILVTPFIAKPMESAQVVRPDDGFQDATDPQSLLLGRINRLYGTAGPGPGRGTGGRFGFITD